MLANTERPYGFDAMVGQREIVENIRKQSIINKFFQVYMLGGQFGSGKTTMARIIALAANCKNKDENGNPCLKCEECKQILSGHSVDVIEMDAASNTGVDSIRELKETVSFLPAMLAKKVYIIDEVHMLSNGAFNALLKILEEPPKHVLFILCTTEWKKIPATVRSRAAKYYFGQIAEEDMCRHMNFVAKKHGIRAEESALRLIAKNSDGAMRNALSLLEQAGEDVTEAIVAEMLGLTDSKYLFRLIDDILNADRMKAVETADELYRSGKEPYRMISDMLDICSDCIMMVHGAGKTINGTAAYIEQVAILSDGRSPEMFCSVIDGLLQIRQEIKQMPEKTTLICGIIRMLSDSGSAIAVLSGQVKALSAQVESIFNEGALCGKIQEKMQGQGADIEEISEVPVSDNCFGDCLELSFDSSGEWEDSIMAEKPCDSESGNSDRTHNTGEKLCAEDAENSDLFDIFGIFDESTDEEEMIPEKTGLDDVQILCNRNPLIRSILSSACKIREEDGKTVYVTNQAPVFKLLQQQEKKEGSLPFAYRLET